MSNTTVVDNAKEHVWHHLTQHKAFEDNAPLVVSNANGMIITDSKGDEYLDATSGGVWTVNLGYGRDEMVKVVSDQISKIPYFAGAFGNEPASQYAQEITSLMPGMNRVYYSNSGSEANEKGYKMVRQLAHFDNEGKKHKIIYRDRDYHGTTIGAMSSSAQIQRKKQYGPFAPGFVEMPNCCCYRCPFGKKYGECNIECAHDLERVILEEGQDNVASVVLEPITAGGGIIVPVEEYYPIIQSICKKYDVLLHIDEVVCGFGRTGEWFGYQNYDMQPDIVTMAKGLASGYAAISCTVTNENVFNRFKSNPDDKMSYFRDISTFGGCAGGHAAAIENLAIIERENLVKNSQKIGEYLLDKLKGLRDKHEFVGDARGKGLLAGIELIKNSDTNEPVHEHYAIKIANYCKKKGILIGRTNRSIPANNNTICLTPALIAGRSEIDTIVHTLDEALENIHPLP